MPLLGANRTKYVADSGSSCFTRFMSDRDSTLVFVAMATFDGTMSEATRELWDRLDEPLGAWRFIKVKVHGVPVGRARNNLTKLAVDSYASKLLMLDSDINAGTVQLERLLGHKEKVVGGIYPRKEVNWPPRFVFNASGPALPTGLQPCREIGAGFLKIDLEVIEKIIADNPSLTYLSDAVQDDFEPCYDIWNESVIVDEWFPGKPAFARKLSEDYAFCRLARLAGFEVWADTICQVGHIGQVDFLQVAAQIQACMRSTVIAAAARPSVPESTARRPKV